ncbi:MAG: (Fe-S)-binding protein [Alicyclobacillus sp.]|nr:(Fe-S)-binding protein [Alicyclobacillus sp.]
MRAALMTTCLVDQCFPQVAAAVVRVLAACGVRVEVPAAQTCCGQPAYNSGFAAEARAVGQTLLAAFADAEYVVTPSGSCAGMVHHVFPSLFQDDPHHLQQAQALAAKTYEFSQFLVQVLRTDDVGAVFPYRVTFHPSCHGLRLLGVRAEPLRLLQRVRGLTYVELPAAEDCCGFGGTFAVKLPALSTAMVDEKVRNVLATGAEVLVSTDMGCLMNIGGRLRRLGHQLRVLHLAELLAEGMQQGGR